MSSLTRMLAVLDEFTTESPSLSAGEIMERLSYSQGTAYRYLRELTSAGLLSNFGGQYSLGPRIIEMDFQIRQNDPYTQIVQPIMRELSDRLFCDTLMCSFYQGRIVVRHHEQGTEQFTMSYGRGRRMPLFRGAPSKCILASLPKSKLRQLFEENRQDIDRSVFPSDWDGFYRDVKKLRQTGYSISKGELDPGNVGVAAPLRTTPLGCLSFVFSGSRFEIADERLVGQIIVDAARQANDRIEAINTLDAATYQNPIVGLPSRKAKVR